MDKTLTWRLFGWGGIPRRLRPALEAEGISLLEEGLPGRLVVRNLKAPGRRYRHRWEGFSGCLVVTAKRLLVCSYWKVQINIGLDDPRLGSVHLALLDPRWLSIWFDSNVFHDDWNGVIELRLRTDRAPELHATLRSLGMSGGLPPS